MWSVRHVDRICVSLGFVKGSISLSDCAWVVGGVIDLDDIRLKLSALVGMKLLGEGKMAEYSLSSFAATVVAC